jgi:hypothetical protein
LSNNAKAEVLEEAGKAYALGKVFEFVPGGRVGSAASGAALGATQAYLNGGDAKDILSEGVAMAAFALPFKGQRFRDIAERAATKVVKSGLAPDAAMDSLLNVARYGKGIINATDGRKMVLYGKNGEVLARELSPNEQIRGNKVSTVPTEQFDQLAQQFGVKTKSPAKALPEAVAKPEPIVPEVVAETPAEAKPVKPTTGVSMDAVRAANPAPTAPKQRGIVSALNAAEARDRSQPAPIAETQPQPTPAPETVSPAKPPTPPVTEPPLDKGSTVKVGDRTATVLDVAGNDVFVKDSTGREMTVPKDRVTPVAEQPVEQPKFSKTHVVDSVGEPLTVFHGTPSESIDVFDRGRAGSRSQPETKIQGFYFTPDRKNAKVFGPNVIAARLNIENPLIVDGRINGEDEARALAEGHDGIIQRGGGEYVVFDDKQIQQIRELLLLHPAI